MPPVTESVRSRAHPGASSSVRSALTVTTLWRSRAAAAALSWKTLRSMYWQFRHQLAVNLTRTTLPSRRASSTSWSEYVSHRIGETNVAAHAVVDEIISAAST